MGRLQVELSPDLLGIAGGPWGWHRTQEEGVGDGG